MTFSETARRVEKLATDNSPLILTAIGVTGVVGTAILTGKAAIKADRLIAKEEFRLHRDDPYDSIEARDKFLLVWKLYIPAATCAALTVSSIIMANQIGTRRAAAVAAAYGLSEKAFSEYRDQVVKKLGEKQERDVRDDVATEQVRRNPVNESQIIVTGDGEQLFHEAYTGRYFKSTVETVKAAQNKINYQVNHRWYASLSDFYDHLGLPHTKVSDDVGWNSDSQLEVTFTAVMSEDGNKPCISIQYYVEPTRDFTNTK